MLEEEILHLNKYKKVQKQHTKTAAAKMQFLKVAIDYKMEQCDNINGMLNDIKFLMLF